MELVILYMELRELEVGGSMHRVGGARSRGLHILSLELGELGD